MRQLLLLLAVTVGAATLGSAIASSAQAKYVYLHPPSDGNDATSQ